MGAGLRRAKCFDEMRLVDSDGIRWWEISIVATRPDQLN